MQKRIAGLFPEAQDIPAAYRIDAPIRQDSYLVNGQLRTWSGPLQEIRSPIRVRAGHGAGQPLLLGEVPLLDEAAAREALSVAVQAYDNGRGTWPTMSVGERIRCVQRFVTALRRKKEQVVRLLMWEIGKSVKEATAEFDRALAYVKDTLEALKELDRQSSRFVIQQGIIGQIRRAPLGVVLCMGPYNFPLYETFTTLIPALVMGNTILLKPPRFGILVFQPLLEAFRDAFPAGVVNTVYGEGETVIPPLMASGQVDVLGFIGTHKVADALRAIHPRPHRLRCVLGLDAKNPAIVLPDAELGPTVQECIRGSLTYNGQRCTALKIVFVHRSLADRFVAAMAEELERIACGMPWDEGVTVTPLPEPEKPAYLQGLIRDAQDKGARVVNRGGGTASASLVYPALLYPVSPAMRVYHEEQFGPVVPVVPFDDINEVIDYVVASPYGQQASIFGRNSDLLARLVDALVNQVCRININSQCQRSPDSFPFNGRKNSAEGTQSVADALRIFSIRIVVAARETELNREIINDIVKERKSHFLTTDFIL
ncbi:NADP-dependent glyceraldehyde-3-phosphate dehydrogenase [Geobacter sp. SVR]|uniref:NADP-dependent glyceraldehyde-3-phosphate dehydrogenase n=1 Tax=Geobacter sp. SVR TaxID=2495594 RepID=UPI00143EF510|nr:NADP-dependent glyceraldehyde-3-phosphate dehydrogenase [Geobacter sp. SVR]BCS53614.1 glyceraldehyde-3-phosphate dehydrogenase [Geobacter sp. SVR]GCF84189.1 glyceraldehyde-3-phosphate dehydrogenase [Geobacter sp. SVR]